MRAMDRLAVIVRPDDPADTVIRRMGTETPEKDHAGIAVVVDDLDRVCGVLVDGDIRRAYVRDTDFRVPVRDVMSVDPVAVPTGLASEDVVAAVRATLRGDPRRRQPWMIRHVLVLDDERRLVDIYDYFQLLVERDPQWSDVAVIGMGHIGLTLAVSLANRGHSVTGIEAQEHLVAALNDGISHILEPGLDDMLRVQLARRTIRFQDKNEDGHHQVCIMAVGTPVDASGAADLSAVREVSSWIGSRLRRRDLVMLRSTVPASTTRDVVAPLLETASGLKAGTDFSLAFTPERTVAGDALRELRHLPQVVGGLTPHCSQRAVNFWTTLAASVVPAETLEAAELVKLANNAFRDLSFAFSNELSLIADRFNINAFRLIETSNEGYSRNPIPRPSPGVGGYCLTKDPLMYGGIAQADGEALNIVGRRINARAAHYPVLVVERFAKRVNRDTSSLVVLIVGVAFKGEPETNDVRGSIALDVARDLREQGSTVRGWDAVVASDEIRTHGIEPVGDLGAAVRDVDAVLILNNHKAHLSPGLFVIASTRRPKLIFDGWSQLDPDEIRKVPGLVYATMGQMSADA